MKMHFWERPFSVFSDSSKNWEIGSNRDFTKIDSFVIYMCLEGKLGLHYDEHENPVEINKGDISRIASIKFIGNKKPGEITRLIQQKFFELV